MPFQPVAGVDGPAPQDERLAQPRGRAEIVRRGFVDVVPLLELKPARAADERRRQGTGKLEPQPGILLLLPLPVLAKPALLSPTAPGGEKGSTAEPGPNGSSLAALRPRDLSDGSFGTPNFRPSAAFAVVGLACTHVQQRRSHALSSGVLPLPSIAAAALLRFELRISSEEESPATPRSSETSEPTPPQDDECNGVSPSQSSSQKARGLALRTTSVDSNAAKMAGMTGQITRLETSARSTHDTS